MQSFHLWLEGRNLLSHHILRTLGINRAEFKRRAYPLNTWDKDELKEKLHSGMPEPSQEDVDQFIDQHYSGSTLQDLMDFVDNLQMPIQGTDMPNEPAQLPVQNDIPTQKNMSPPQPLV